MRYITAPQGSEEWLQARVGKITASRYKDARDRLKPAIGALKEGAVSHQDAHSAEWAAPAVIDDLLVRYIEALIYQAVAENMASEQSARMVAMKAATDNAGTLIGELKLVYNKTRQAAITKELSEIVAGAAAV